MDLEAYALAAEVEERHWWFCGRRMVLQSVLDRFAPRADSSRSILEVGCGNGGNLPLLATHGKLFAAELDDGARARAAQRGLARVEKGWLPDAVPFGDERFDLITALDVIEHVEDDGHSIATLRARLKPGGLLLLTVPAYPWLWSKHDVFAHHRRRYTRAGAISQAEKAGLDVIYSTYFNTLLFPLAAAYITFGGWLSRDPATALKVPPAWINRTLQAIFSLERRLIPRWSLPFGISILLCARAKG